MGRVLFLLLVLIIGISQGHKRSATLRCFQSPVAARNCEPCAGDWPLATEEVDFLVVGGGPAGILSLYDLSRAVDSGTTLALVEARAELGGNFRAISVNSPTGYNASSSSSFGPLMADVGAQRINALTLTEERRLFSELQIKVYASPFRNIIHARGRRTICQTPQQMAYSSNPNDIFAYGDFCTYGPEFSDPTSGAFRGSRVTAPTNFSGCSDYTKGGDGRCSVYPSNDPSYNGYQWLLQGNDAPAFDLSVSQASSGGTYYFGDGYKHPLTQSECNASSTCPVNRCKARWDWKTFVASELATSNGTLNYEYANFMRADNVGFYGDYEQGFGACSYSNYQAREWNTPSINMYPEGGMTELTKRMANVARSRGARIYTNEALSCIRRSRRSGIKFEVRTATKTFLVRQFVIMSIPTPSLLDPNVVSGEVMADLRAQREMHRARAQVVASVVMQWPPGRPAWFWRYFEQNTGNYSVRTYGDTACFSRIDLIDSPWHRCTNAIRAIYSDFQCRQMFQDMIDEGKRTGSYALLEQRVLQELKFAFPEAAADITAPVLTYGEIVNPAWYWSRPQEDDITNEQHAEWAAHPLPSDPLCLASESVHSYYQGWSEGAFRSSRQCLTRNFVDNNTPLGARLKQLWAQRDAIVPGDGTYASDFQNVPPASGVQFFPNEQWWPYNYTSTVNYCDKTQVVMPTYRPAK